MESGLPRAEMPPHAPVATDTLPRHRALFGLGCVLVLFGILVGRLADLQLGSSSPQDPVRRWTEGTIAMDVPRGDILDRRGRPLAVSVRSYGCAFDPYRVEDVYEPLKALQGVLALERPEMERILNRVWENRFAVEQARRRGEEARLCRFVWIRREVGDEEAAAIRSLGLAGVRLVPQWRRTYPQGETAGHVIGFASRDGEGLEGIEFVADAQLRSVAGQLRVRRDARRRLFVAAEEVVREPRPGLDVRLTLDSYIQHLAERELSRVAVEFEPQSATAVCMDPRTGDILALANYPAFSPADAWNTDPALRLNEAVAAIYEPGSVFKPFVLAAALDRGVVTRQSRVFCENGAWNLRYRVLHDAHGYGWLTAAGVVIKSSNIGIAKVAQSLGPEKLHSYLDRFGFGHSTGSGLIGELPGLFRPVAEWNPRFSMTSLPMGQEVSVTPLQLATAFCTLANGGMLMRPRLIEAALDESGAVRETYPPVSVRRVVSRQAAEAVRHVLRRVVTEGTGRRVKGARFPICGKTGTAQIAGPGGYQDGAYVATFCGFAPYEDPRLVVLVSVTRPQRQHYGGVVSAPAVAHILEGALSYLRVPVPGRSLAMQ